MIMMLTSVSTSIEINHARRLLFGNHKTSTMSATTTEEPSSGQNFNKWLDVLLSGNFE